MVEFKMYKENGDNQVQTYNKENKKKVTLQHVWVAPVDWTNIITPNKEWKQVVPLHYMTSVYDAPDNN